MSGDFIFALSIIILGLLFGRGLRIFLDKGRIQSPDLMHRLLKISTMSALLVVNPIIIFGAFWFVQLNDIRLLGIPVLGGLTIALGGFGALLVAKYMKLSRAKQGSMFASGTFTNLGSFGNLFCFVFLGEASLVFVALFRLFEDLIYYAVGFPVAQSYGNTETAVRTSLVKKLLFNPFIIVTLSAIFAGGALNLSAFERPEFYASLNEFLVPLFTILLVVPTGFNLKVGKAKNYLKESFAVAAVKFAAVPSIVILFAYFFGLRELYDGIAFQVIIILAMMPPGFTSLVPPQLFKLDQNLANSSWFINTLLLVVILPFLYFVVLN